MPNKYKITNTTIKLPRLNPRTGKDMRTAVERVGHGVSIRAGANEQIIIQPHRARLFDNVSEGMLRLRDGKFISIEEIGDVSDVLKSHVAGTKADIFAPDKAAQATILDDVHKSVGRQAKVAPIGEDTHSQDSGKETEGAVNPDGEPNFFVKADKNLKRKMRAPQFEAHVEEK